MDTACIIDGPEWWGDPSTTPEGRPVRLEDAAERSGRREGAQAERAALEAAVGALPPDCLVLHTAGRGAGACAATFAARQRRPVSAWPAFPGGDGVWPRNRALTAALVGLRESGWAVKALIFGPDHGVCPDQRELADLLRSHAIPVRSIVPYIAPPEEPEPAADGAAEETEPVD